MPGKAIRRAMAKTAPALSGRAHGGSRGALALVILQSMGVGGRA